MVYLGKRMMRMGSINIHRPIPELSRSQRHEARIGDTLLVFETEPLNRADEDMLLEDDRGRSFKKIVSLRVRSKETGEIVDLLSLICPSGTAVFMSEEPLQGYHHVHHPIEGPLDESPHGHKKRTSLYLTCPPLQDDIAVATLFHEAGHSRQEWDQRTRKLSPYYAVGEELFAEKRLYAFDSWPFSLAANIIDLCPELEESRDTIEEMRQEYGTMVRRIFATREKMDTLERRREVLATQTADQKQRIDDRLREDMRPFLDEIERIMVVHGLAPSEQARKPIDQETATALQQDLLPYGIRFVEMPIYGEDLELFIHWLKKDPIAMTKVVGDLEPADGDKAMKKPFVSTRHGSYFLDMEIRKESLPFRSSSETYEDSLETLSSLRREVRQLTKERSELYHESRIELNAEQFAVLKDVLAHPMREIERDATWRALLWLRFLRETHGVNLLERPAAETRNALSKLLGCLDTYGARVDPFKKVAQPTPRLGNPLRRQERSLPTPSHPRHDLHPTA